MTVAYVVTYLRTPYGACEKFLENNRTAPVRRPYDDDTVSVRVLRAPYPWAPYASHGTFPVPCTDRTWSDLVSRGHWTIAGWYSDPWVVVTLGTTKHGPGLPRDAMLAQYLLSSRVRLSVTIRYCIKTAKRRISKTTVRDSPGAPLLWSEIQCISTKFRWHHPNAAPNGVGTNCVFRPVDKSPRIGRLTPLPPKICVHPPRWSASTAVRWRRSMRCHQQRLW